MNLELGIFGLLALLLLLGAGFGWIAFFWVSRLSRKVAELERLLRPGGEQPADPAPHPEAAPRPAAAVKAVDRDTTADDIGAHTDEFRRSPESGDPSRTGLPRRRNRAADLLNGLRRNWMIWLGGISVGLAGIFLVKYSIDSGLLGPAQRVGAAVLAGLGLHGLAEWLRRRHGEPHPAFAALAGGASITLYAAMLAALHLYDLLGPMVVFTALALISLATMLLALWDGPVLAIIGLLGGYIVPILVSSDSGTIVGAMIYSLIISAAALLLMRRIYRAWLWYGMLAGGLGWWLLSFSSSQPDGLRGPYLALLAYFILALPAFDWLLSRRNQAVRPKTQGMALVLLIIAQGVSIGYESFSPTALAVWSPLTILVLRVGCLDARFRLLPWFSLIIFWFAWLFCGLDLSGPEISYRGLELQTQRNFLVFLAGTAALYTILPWWQGRGQGLSHLRSSLICLAPTTWLALAYLLATDLSIHWEWGICSGVLAMVYLTLANLKLSKNPEDPGALWLILASHFAFALAAAMLLRQASLTLVLATQIVSLTLLWNRYRLTGLQWAIKGLLILVIVRLTANPWLLHYPAEVHWSLWTYGGSAICCGIAAWLTPAEFRLRKWLEGAGLHLLVLFAAAESRYWLYDGEIFARTYTLTEASINTILWASLGLVYHYRARFSEHLRTFYNTCAALLLLLALANYSHILTSLNPLWSGETISSRPLWNLLLPAYGAPVVLALLCMRYYQPKARQLAAIVSGFSFFVFVNLEIRHLWQGTLDIWLPFIAGELYTYSIVWLLVATIAILLAAYQDRRGLYRTGMVLLLAVIAKIFLVDMSDLQGLLRVTSFLGLGLSLLALAYLHQKLAPESSAQDPVTGDDSTQPAP